MCITANNKLHSTTNGKHGFIVRTPREIYTLPENGNKSPRYRRGLDTITQNIVVPAEHPIRNMNHLLILRFTNSRMTSGF